jgi:hypothetical protein
MVLARLLSAQPTTDGEKWKLRFAAHNDAWYTDAYGQNPAPFLRDPSGLNPQSALPYIWQPVGGLFIWPSYDDRQALQSGIGLSIDRSVYPAIIKASGNTPCNIAASSVFAPRVPLTATETTSGGSIPAGTYYIAVSWDSLKGPVSQLVKAVATSGSANYFTINGIKWPDSAAPSPGVFMGSDPINLKAVTFTGSVNDANGNPTTIEVDQVPVSGLGMPDPNFQRFVMHATTITHGGVWGGSLTANSGSTATISGAGWTVNQWAGYVLTLYYRDQTTQPGLNLEVVSNTADTLTLSHSGFLSGDVVVMRAAAAHITASTIGDDNFVNSFATAGLDTGGAEIGKLIRIIGGTGAGQPGKTVSSNTSTVYTINGAWDVTPDSTSIWIVTEPSPAQSKTTSVITNDGLNLDFGVVVDAPAPSTAAQSLLIEVATADVHGNHFPMRMQPFREVYIPAQPVAALTADGEYEIPNATITRTLAASLNSSATTTTLDAATSLPTLPFLATCGTECIRVTARSGASITAMDRAWAGTTAAAHSSGSNFVIVTATPDLAQGKMQLETLTAHTTILAPDNSPGPGSWRLDLLEDGTGGWAALLSAGYVGYQPSESAGGGINTNAGAGTFIDFVTRASGDINTTGVFEWKNA